MKNHYYCLLFISFSTLLNAQDYYQGVGAKGIIGINNHDNLQNHQNARTSSVYGLLEFSTKQHWGLMWALILILQYLLIHWSAF